MPPPNEQDRTAFTKSESILMDYQKLKKMSAQDIKDLIQDVLHNKEFTGAWTSTTAAWTLSLPRSMSCVLWKGISDLQTER